MFRSMPRGNQPVTPPPPYFLVNTAGIGVTDFDVRKMLKMGRLQNGVLRKMRDRY